MRQLECSFQQALQANWISYSHEHKSYYNGLNINLFQGNYNVLNWTIRPHDDDDKPKVKNYIAPLFFFIIPISFQHLLLICCFCLWRYFKDVRIEDVPYEQLMSKTFLHFLCHAIIGFILSIVE